MGKGTGGAGRATGPGGRGSLTDIGAPAPSARGPNFANPPVMDALRGGGLNLAFGQNGVPEQRRLNTAMNRISRAFFAQDVVARTPNQLQFSLGVQVTGKEEKRIRKLLGATSMRSLPNASRRNPLPNYLVTW